MQSAKLSLIIASHDHSPQPSFCFDEDQNNSLNAVRSTEVQQDIDNKVLAPVHSETVFAQEFKEIVKRSQDYRSEVAQPDVDCHSCNKKLPPVSYYKLLFTDAANLYCYHCMAKVCSLGCLHPTKIAVPVRFNFMFDCEPLTVCPSSYKHLKKY